MKHLLRLGFVFAGVLSLSAADPHDNKSLRGDWVPVKAELGGQAMSDEVLKTISMKLGDGTYHVDVAGKPDKGTYEVDASTLPTSMDIKGTEGPNKGRVIPAIYEKTGQTLRICYDLAREGAKRPREFKSEPGTRLYLVTYERKK
jgi:uncharacterized protein (TIGR03067 family)